VFSVCGTSTRVFALDEQLGLGGGGATALALANSSAARSRCAFVGSSQA
jgi:hypothetical protein